MRRVHDPIRWVFLMVLALLALLALGRSCARGQVVEHVRPVVLRAQGDVAVPPPFLGTQSQRPAPPWVGRGMTRTVDRFAPAITGWLVRSEFHEAAGYFWNDNNLVGDTAKRTVLALHCGHRTIDGQGKIPPYPWSKPPTPWRADGVVIRGRGTRIENLCLFQIPGTALVLRDGTGEQAGTFSAFEQLTTVDNLHVSQSINGFLCECLDAKLSGVWITGIEKDGLTLNAPNVTLTDSHVWGADVAARIKQISQLSGTCYHEAARVGTLVEESAHGTVAERIYIGPATCREVAVKIEANGVTIGNVAGDVAATAVGVDILPKTRTAKIGCQYVINAGGTGTRFGGALHQIGQRSWARAGATAVKVLPCVGCTLDLRVMDYGEGGIALDLSASGLDKSDGRGNVFRVWMADKMKIIYPGGGERYNLAPGSELWINGERAT